MEPTAAMAHTRLAASSIPEPSREAALTDTNVMDTESETEGEGARRGEGEGRRDLDDRKLTSYPGFATGVYPCWNKDCQPSSACPTLKPPPTRPASLAFTRMAGSNTDTHTHTCAGFCIFELKKKKEWSRRGRGREMINKRPIMCSVTELKENSYMPAFHYTESTQVFSGKTESKDVQIAVLDVKSLAKNKKRKISKYKV